MSASPPPAPARRHSERRSSHAERRSLSVCSPPLSSSAPQLSFLRAAAVSSAPQLSFLRAAAVILSATAVILSANEVSCLNRHAPHVNRYSPWSTARTLSSPQAQPPICDRKTQQERRPFDAAPLRFFALMYGYGSVLMFAISRSTSGRSCACTLQVTIWSFTSGAVPQPSIFFRIPLRSATASART